MEKCNIPDNGILCGSDLTPAWSVPPVKAAGISKGTNKKERWLDRKLTSESQFHSGAILPAYAFKAVSDRDVPQAEGSQSCVGGACLPL